MESLDEGEFLFQQRIDPSEAKCEQMIVDAVGVLINWSSELVLNIFKGETQDYFVDVMRNLISD